MAKSVHADVLDGAINILKNNVTRMTLCSAQPTTYAEGNATYNLAQVTLAPADIVAAAGDTSGRKGTVAAKVGVAVTVTGTGNHVALLDVVGLRLLYVTTCAAQAVGAAGTVDIGTWKAEIAAPT